MSFSESVSKWETEKLSLLADYISRGITPKYTDDKNQSILVVNQRCIREGKVLFEDARRHDIEKKKVSEEKFLRDFDVLVNSTGVGTLGRVSQIKKVYEPTTVDSHVTIVRGNSDYIDKKYLGYAIKAQQSIIENMAEGSTGQTELSRKRLGDEIVIGFPKNKQEQKAIAHILSTLDDKIEVNNQINKTLENMAQAIFKQWFVDFEFPNEDGEPYKSSGGEMVESELGMIPKGWEVGSFSEYISSMLGGDWGKDSPQGNYTQKVYCLRGADINDIVAGNKGKMPERYIIEKNLIKKKLNSGNLVVEISGGSPTQSTGRIAYVSSDLLKRYNSPLVATNFCRAIKLKKDEHMEFFYNYWKALYQNNVFFHYENGTTGIKNLDISSFIERHPIVIPNENIIKMFTHQVKLFYKMHQNYGVENSQIETLRDSLLPKLMSGEIRVPMDEEGDVS